MAENLTIKSIDAIPSAYDKYFVSLAEGKPAALEIPELSAETLADVLNEALPASVTPGDARDVLDTAKIGFTTIKFAKAGKPGWWTGYKLTGTLYYPPEASETPTAFEQSEENSQADA